MADNVAITAGTGTDIAADEISSVKYQRVKVVLGADGVNDGDVASGNPLPVTGTITAVTAITNALPAGTNAIGKLSANSGVDIGDVDVISSALPTGASTAANQTTTNNSLSSIDGKITACNTGAVVVSSGTITAVTSITNAVAVTNAGITSIDGKITACNTGAVAGTVTANAGTNLNTSALALETGGNLAACATSLAILDDWDDSDKCKISDGAGSITVDNGGTFAVQAEKTIKTGYGQGKCDNADTTTAREVVAAVAGKKLGLTSIVISVAATGNYWLEDGDAAQITPKFYLAANGGCSITCPADTPYITTTANKALNIKGSTAGAVGCMVTYYTI